MYSVPRSYTVTNYEIEGKIQNSNKLYMKHNPLETSLNKNNLTNKAFIVEVNLKLLHFLYHFNCLFYGFIYEPV